MTLTSSNICIVAPTDVRGKQQDYVIRKLKKLGVSLALSIEEGAALIEAHVPSGEAARMLEPLGRGALGQFWVVAGNMVVISAIVTLEQAQAMLAKRELRG